VWRGTGPAANLATFRPGDFLSLLDLV